MLCPTCGNTCSGSIVEMCDSCKLHLRERESSLVSSDKRNRFDERRENVQVEAVEGDEEFEPAGLWLRFLALQIDNYPMMFISIPCLLVAGLIAYSQFTAAEFEYFMRSPGKLWLVWIVFLWVPAMAYFVIAESSRWQATVGKKVLGLKVITSSGERASAMQCLVRAIGRVVSLFLPIVFLAVLLRDDKAALHDSISSTHVVKTKLTTSSRVGLWTMLVVFGPALLSIILTAMLPTLFGNLLPLLIELPQASPK